MTSQSRKRDLYTVATPPGQGRRGRIKGPDGEWVCDSEEIAREVVRRLNAGELHKSGRSRSS